MEIFKTLRQHLKALAYFRPEKGESKTFYIFQNTMISIAFVFILITTSYCFFLEAKTFNELAESFYFGSTAVLVFTNLIQLALIKTKVTKHFVTLEKFVQNRKLMQLRIE